MTNSPASGDKRRYDFDALRSAAMLAGIFYHFSLPFSQGFLWFVINSSRSPELYLLQKALHGCRMQVFFVLSGFFTAMLWRKKGVNFLLRHRFRRVFLPLVLGSLTIVPVCFYLFTMALQKPLPQKAPVYVQSSRAKWHSEFGATPLSLAVAAGQKATVERLLKEGVDPNEPNRDGSLPLHMATLFGRAKIFQTLVEAGADASATKLQVETLSRLSAREVHFAHLMSNWLHLPFDQQSWQHGSKEIRRQIGITDTKSIWWNILRQFPFFTHLWFLWYLFLMVLILYACSTGCKRIRPLSWPNKLPVLNPTRFAWLVPLTVILQWSAKDPPLLTIFGPTVSASLLPDPFTFFYYGLFFLFGILYFDSNDETGKLGKHWPLTFVVALFIVYPLNLELTRNSFGLLNLSLDKYLHHLFTCIAEALYSWLMVFSFMGLARTLFKKENPTIRYISDSSYWLYLAHLPLVVVVQMWATHWPFPVWVSFLLGSAGITGVLLLTYEFFVRYTWIGRFLNGPRTRKAK